MSGTVEALSHARIANQGCLSYLIGLEETITSHHQ